MAVMAGVLDETRRRTLEALCDTIVPSVEYDGPDETMRAFMARSASDMGIAAQIEGLMAQAMLQEEIEGFRQLLDGIAQAGFDGMPAEARTQVLKQVAASGPEAKLGIKVFKNLTLLFFYALPDAQGRNPNWEAIGYPGPISAAPSAEQTLTADAVVIGSGAGGGVIAAELQNAGTSVVVLEQGAYRNEQDFNQL